VEDQEVDGHEPGEHRLASKEDPQDGHGLGPHDGAPPVTGATVEKPQASGK